jgi:hypothetical protein
VGTENRVFPSLLPRAEKHEDVPMHVLYVCIRDSAPRKTHSVNDPIGPSISEVIRNSGVVDWKLIVVCAAHLHVTLPYTEVKIKDLTISH